MKVRGHRVDLVEVWFIILTIDILIFMINYIIVIFIDLFLMKVELAVVAVKGVTKASVLCHRQVQ